MLELQDVTVKYGVAVALHGVSLNVERGDAVALLGANGAGKSTIVNAVSGVVPVAAGAIRFEGQRIDGVAAHRIVKLGIAQVPEGRLVFPNMTVAENLELGAVTVRDRRRKNELRDQVLVALPAPEGARAPEGGRDERRRAGDARVRPRAHERPKLILTDEVSMGLAPVVVRDIYATLARINRELGVTLLMVEQDARLALSVANRAYVIETGRIATSGRAEDLLNDDAVRKAYLGGA